MKIVSIIKIIIGVSLFSILLSTGLMLLNTEDIKSYSTIINQAGSIRGGTQRLVKLEIEGIESEDLIIEIDNLIEGLSYKQEDNQIFVIREKVLKDVVLQSKLQEILPMWKELKEEIYRVRQSKNTDTLIKKSEAYYKITNEFVAKIEACEIERIEELDQVELSILIINILLMMILGMISRVRITKPLNHLIATISKLNITDNVRNDFLLRKDEIGELSRGIQRVITEMREANDVVLEKNKELRTTAKEIAKLSNIINESINVIFTTDYNGTIHYVNSNFEKVTGYSSEESIGENPRFLASGRTNSDGYKEMWDTIKSGKVWRGVLKNKKKNGEYYWANGFISPIRNEKGEITDFLAIQEDITQEIKAKKKVAYLSNYDKLTGLNNRESFMANVDSKIADIKSHEEYGLFMHVDMDGLSFINNSFGHGIGDQLLVSFAELLVEQVDLFRSLNNLEGAFLIGRLDGDEFAIFLSDKNKNIGLEFAKYIKETIEHYQFLNGLVNVTASIGITIYPEHAGTSSELLTKAVATTMQVKREGHNGYLMYKKDELFANIGHDIMEVKQLINRALEEDRITPWYQPIYNMKTGEIHHYEVLARVIDEDGTIIYPNKFIPVAEEYGLISSIDKKVFEKSVEYLKELEEQGKVYSFAINISGKNLGDEDILEYMSDILDQLKTRSSNIVFEITETAAINNLEKAAQFVKILKEKGCKFALDDFGIGFTSFVHISELNVDYVKVDGSFVRRIVESKKDREIVASIGGMCKALGIETIAEYVETKEILDILSEIDIDYAQGYYIGKPLQHVLE